MVAARAAATAQLYPAAVELGGSRPGLWFKSTYYLGGLGQMNLSEALFSHRQTRGNNITHRGLLGGAGS